MFINVCITVLFDFVYLSRLYILNTSIISSLLLAFSRLQALTIVLKGQTSFALNKIIQDVPAKVILENWEGKNNIVSVLKTLAQYVTDFTGAKNVETIYGIIDEIVSI